MSKMKKLLIGAVTLVLVLSTAPMFIWAQDLPGVTVSDDFPNGCVDCHSGESGGEDTLNELMSDLEGHPNVEKIMKQLPTDCYMCHKENMPAGPINYATHLSHYGDPDESDFINEYDGACLNCHSIDLDTGEIIVKSGPKNW